MTNSAERTPLGKDFLFVGYTDLDSLELQKAVLNPQSINDAASAGYTKIVLQVNPEESVAIKLILRDFNECAGEYPELTANYLSKFGLEIAQVSGRQKALMKAALTACGSGMEAMLFVPRSQATEDDFTKGVAAICERESKSEATKKFLALADDLGSRDGEFLNLANDRALLGILKASDAGTKTLVICHADYLLEGREIKKEIPEKHCTIVVANEQGELVGQATRTNGILKSNSKGPQKLQPFS